MPAPRVAPRRSPLEVEVSHLLRHLGLASALRCNALVGHLFGADSDVRVLAQIRAYIENALGAMAGQAVSASRARARRRREILVRYDAAGEPAKKVAAELGLSRRHFYRERRAATLDLGTRLRRLLPPSRAVTESPVDLHEVAEAAAYALDFAGAPAQACSKFLVLAATTPDVGRRIRALCDAARILIDLFDSAGAERALAEARRLLAEIPRSSEVPYEQAGIAVELTSALVRCHAPAAVEAYQLARPALRKAAGFAHELDATGLHIQVRERLRHANRLACNGYGAEAMVLIHECQPMLDLLAGRVSYLGTAYAAIRAAVLLECRGPTDEVLDLASAAYRRARQEGNFTIAAYAGLTLATTLAAQRSNQAEGVARAALDLALDSNSPNLLAHARLRVAHVLNEVGDASAAAELSRLVVGTAGLSPRFKSEARLVHAQALLALGDVATAQTNALEACRRFDGDDRRLVSGLASRILAQCESARGNAAAAARHFARALETLDSGSHARILYFTQRDATPVLQPGECRR